MLANIFTKLNENSIYKKIVNIQNFDNNYLNFFWIGVSLLFLTLFGTPFIVNLALFIISTKALLFTLDITYLRRLVKFWCFSFILTQAYSLMYYFIGNNIYTNTLEAILTYNLVILSFKWFNENNMILSNHEGNNGEVNNNETFKLVDTTIEEITKLYKINYLPLDYYVRFIAFITKKLYLAKNYLTINQYFGNKLMDTIPENIINPSITYTIPTENIIENIDETKEETDNMLNSILNDTLNELGQNISGQNISCLNKIDLDEIDEDFVINKN